jgi:membrane protease YdiL (CAAX protease family)
MLLTASRGVAPGILSRLGSAAGILLCSALFLAYVFYLLNVGALTIPRLAAAFGLIFIPLALAAAAGRQPAGAWQDFAVLLEVWVTVKFLPLRWLWPYPSENFSHVFTVLLIVNVGIAIFLFTRGLDGIGYSVGWGPRWGLYIGGSFLAFAGIAVPFGLAIHFVQFAPRWSTAASLPAVALGVLVLTAWPEEFLFRGLLQNLLARSTKSDLVSWCLASILFGFSHITNGRFPNWRYVLLASIAGFFYGWTWRKTNSIFASALVHALVDATWHFLFRTL